MSSDKDPAYESDIHPTYVTTREFPAGPPAVTLAFDGLFTFCFDGSRQVEVGIRNGTGPDDGERKHNLIISATRREGDDVQEPFRHFIGDPQSVTDIRVEISRPVKEGVFVFASDPDPLDFKDFRLVPDLEGPDFYNTRLVKRSDRLKPSVTLSSGLFHTLQKTGSSFRRRDVTGGQDKPIGAIAKIVGVRIDLEDGGSVTLRVDGVRYEARKVPGVFHKITFSNLCRCEGGTNPITLQGDFHLFRQTFELPRGRKEFVLVPDQTGAGGGVILSPCDPAPCGSICYGRSPGI